MPKNIQKECNHHGLTDFTLEGRGYYRCKKCRVEAVVRRRKNVKDQLVQDFGGKCKICGYDRYIGNLIFHHNDPTQKEFGISAQGVTRSYEKTKAEASKCVLVCCRCHGEIHAGLISIPL